MPARDRSDMSVFLTTHPPARQQYRAVRRPSSFPTLVTGAVVVHTAESQPDVTGDDLGAENVARFISTRSDAALDMIADRTAHWLRPT